MGKWRVLSILIGLLAAQTSIAKPHVMLTKEGRIKAGPTSVLLHPEFGKANPTNYQLNYYGGQVLANVRVIGVFWGANVDSTVRSEMADFYTTFVSGGNMHTFLTEYNTNFEGVTGHAGTNQTIGPGNYGGDYQITPAHTSTTLQDADVQAEIAAQITAGNLPASDPNTLYMVHFPPGVSITEDGGTSCQDFCAYHSSYLDQNNKDVFYGVLPDFTQGGCSLAAGGGCGSNPDFENFTSAASHEVTEAITDSQISDVTGTTVDYPAAWYDPYSNEEIGDICAYVTSSTVTSATSNTVYTIQGEWSNAKVECYTGTN